MSVDWCLRPFVAARSATLAWIHASARGDEDLATRHASVVASHLIGGFLAAGVLAAYIVHAGAPPMLGALAVAVFLAPVAIAAFLSRTGRLEVAHALTAAQLTALVMLTAALSGGSSSFAVVWLALVPLEAAVSVNRRMMIATTGLAVAALAVLHWATVSGALPDPVAFRVDPRHVAFATQVAAVLYAGALASTIQALHRRAERRIEAQRAAYRLIAENTSDLITRHDPNGAVTYASLASGALLDCAPDALLGDGLRERLSAEDHRRYRQSFAWCQATGTVASEVYAVKRGCETIWLEMRCQRLPASVIDAHDPATMIAVTRDVTSARLHALALEEAQQVAEKASRAKSAFIAAMSHELRTPLNAIMGFAELLHRELLIKSRDPKQADYCRIIHESGEHLLSLVTDLLDVSKIEAGKLSMCAEPFRLRDVVAASVDTVRPTAQAKGLGLAVEIDGAVSEIVADRRACKQILINLLSNACKFTPEGGAVSVVVRGVGEAVHMSVVDSGIGISPANVARLGEPFFQVDTGYARGHDGAGLGLTIVRGLVELQHGKLVIESAPGSGSRFTVVLPTDVEACEAAPQRPFVEAPARHLSELALAG